MTESRLKLIPAILASVLASACGAPDDATGPSSAILERELTVTSSLAASCSGCHAGGSAIIGLEGLSADALAGSLMRYKAEDGSTVMHRLARGYTDEQIQAIAAYLDDGAAP